MQEPLELAGDYIVLQEQADGSATIRFDDKGTGRECGTCNLCCKLLPVRDIAKPAGVRCKHTKHKRGCMIYADRPFSCRTWSCRWMSDYSTVGLPRPDRAHYVIDMVYDHIVIKPHDGSDSSKITVLQVWVDPAFPDAHRAPYLQQMGEKYRVAAIIRFDSRKALVVFPPSFSTDREWHEIAHGVVVPEAEFHNDKWDVEVAYADPG